MNDMEHGYLYDMQMKKYENAGIAVIENAGKSAYQNAGRNAAGNAGCLRKKTRAIWRMTPRDAYAIYICYIAHIIQETI